MYSPHSCAKQLESTRNSHSLVSHVHEITARGMMNSSVLVPRRHIYQPTAHKSTWVTAAASQARTSAVVQLQYPCTSSPSTSQCAANNSSHRLRGAGSQPVTSLLQRLPERRQRCWNVAAAAAGQISSSCDGSSERQLVHTTWTSPDGAVFQVVEMRSGQSSRSSRPPVVLIHGLFRAAWYWQDSLMPALAAAGFDSYALSLRGQGGSQLYASQPAAASDGQPNDRSSSSSSSSGPFAHGVPLAVNVADIAAFISSRGWSTPPVLVGHSLGGMFVQEYLHQLIRQPHQRQGTPAARSAGSAAALPHLSQPVPKISGAVLLASACAGTVMSFDRFIADVGLLEFLYQMYIVFTCAHLNDLKTARYCWWEASMDEAEAAAHLQQIRSSSSVLPYVTKEVGGWHPAPPEPAALQQLPPVLALGGAADRIIRPFQVSAARDYWGADVTLMDGVTHDMLLGPQASAVSQQLLCWLQEVPLATVRAAKASSSSSGGGASMEGLLSVPFMASSQQQQQQRKV